MGFLTYFVEILIIISVMVGKYLWKLMEKNELAKSLPGPKSLPILGDALVLWCKDEDIFERCVNCVGKYPSPMRFLIGPKLIVIYRDPAQVKQIFASPALANKDEIYRFLKFFNGEGLISASGGPKWKKDRRLMSPLFIKKSIVQYYPIILNHTKILVEILTQKVDSGTFDVEHYVRRATTDFINDSIVGGKFNAQLGELDDFLKIITRAYELVHRRIIKPWLQVDFLHQFTSSYREHIAIKKCADRIFWKILNDAKENHNHLGPKNGSVRTVLEILLDIRDEVPDFATDQEMVEHIATLYSASEDTISTICSFALVMLGMYPEYQEKLASEIIHVVGLDVDIKEEHLDKLEYLEMVMKETLRLFPIGPFIMRQANQDTEIDGLKIPKGTSVTIAIHNMHRDPNFWEKPDDFYPEHFLPINVKNRHPYAYLPFSAGARSCIGKPYAYMALKIMLTTIIQRFVVEADGKLQDKELTTDISVRFKDKMYPIRLKKRVLL